MLRSHGTNRFTPTGVETILWNVSMQRAGQRTAGQVSALATMTQAESQPVLDKLDIVV